MSSKKNKALYLYFNIRTSTHVVFFTTNQTIYVNNFLSLHTLNHLSSYFIYSHYQPNVLYALQFFAPPSPLANEEEDRGRSQRMYHSKNGRSPPPHRHDGQLPATRAPVPRNYPHGNQGSAGYLPSFPRENEARIHRVPSLQRHWGSEEKNSMSLKTMHFIENFE